MINNNHNNIFGNSQSTKPLNYQTNNNCTTNIDFNKNKIDSFIEYIKDKIIQQRDKQLQKIQYEFTQFCDGIIKEIESSFSQDNQLFFHHKVNGDTQSSQIIPLKSKIENHILNNNDYVLGIGMQRIKLEEGVLTNQRSGIQNEQYNKDQYQSNGQSNENSHKISSSTSAYEDQSTREDTIERKDMQPKKRNRIQKEMQTQIHQRKISKKAAEQNQDKPNEKKEESENKNDKLSFKNQIKGFISKYFKRLKKLKDQNILDTEVPFTMFQRMKGSRKKKDLFLILNKFFQQNEPTQTDYDLYIEEKSFQNQLDELKPSDDILQDDSYLEEQQQIKIKEREFELLIQLRQDFNDSQYEGYEGFKEFVNYYNRLTSFFRRDIYKYLMSQNYVHDLCVKRAEKIDQIYIKNIILNLILNPKILM
ncbi:hypothetical protein ABPG74_020188 [Tetrahymena malaccensis]